MREEGRILGGGADFWLNFWFGALARQLGCETPSGFVKWCNPLPRVRSQARDPGLCRVTPLAFGGMATIKWGAAEEWAYRGVFVETFLPGCCLTL
jgi:hypothetical protein